MCFTALLTALFSPLSVHAIGKKTADITLKKKIEKALGQTQKTLDDVLTSIKNTNIEMAALHTDLKSLSQKEQTLKVQLSENVQKHHLALASLTRLERQPLRALLTYDFFKVQPQRAPILAISRKELRNRIENNQKQLTELLKITHSKKEHQERLNKAKTELKKYQKQLLEVEKEQKKLLSLPAHERQKLRKKVEQLAKRGNLKALLALTNSRTGLTPTPQQNMQTLPIDGVVLTHFGQKNKETGIPTNGLVIKGITRQEVLAPHDGRVLYAGPFKGFGVLMILEHTGGFHSLYGGIGYSHHEVGSFIHAGDIIAQLPESTNPNLYLEVRQNGTPINPKKWLPQNKK